MALYERIPLFGYVLSGGKCSQCAAPTSLRYPAVELAAALICFLLFRKYGLSAEFMAKTSLLLLLILVSLIDLGSKTTPHVVYIAGLSAGVVLAFFRRPFFSYQDALSGILVCGGTLFVVAFCCKKLLKVEAISFHDAELLGLIGAFCGLRGAIFSFLAASLFGTLIGIPIMIAKGKGVKYVIPFGPFLSAGALFFIFYGDRFVYGFLRFIGQ